MHRKVRHIKSICFLFLLCLFFMPKLQAQATAHCDSLIVTGIDYMWKKDHVKSLELLTQARNLAEKNRWYRQLFLATNNIGANYYTMLDYGEALNYYLESYTIAVKHLDPISVLFRTVHRRCCSVHDSFFCHDAILERQSGENQ